MTNGEGGQAGAAGDPGGQDPAAGGQDPGAGGGDPGGGADPGAGGGSAGGGSDPQHWMTSLPDGTFDDRSRQILERFTDVPALAQGYMNAFNLVARDKIPMPQTDQEYMETFDRLGRPKEATEYELNVEGNFSDDFKEFMEGNKKWFSETAHKVGLTKTQAANLFKEYVDLSNIQITANNDRVASEMEQATTALKTELGDSYDGKMTLANRAISEIGGEDLVKVFEDSGLGRNPTVVKAFIKMGEMMAEEVGLDIEGQTTDTMEDLDAQIAELQANPAYTDAKNPQHKIMVDKMSKLMARRHPEPKTAPGTIRLF